MTNTAPKTSPTNAAARLRIASAPPPDERRLATAAGPSAAVIGQGGSERIEVRDAAGRPLFELDTATGRAVVMAPAGDLTLAAPPGDIELSARGSIRLRGEKSVELAAEGASLTLERDAARLSARAMAFAAERAELLFGEASYLGARLGAKLTEAKVAAERLETAAGTLFERAKSAFRTVDDLSQLRAGRTRTLVTDGHHLKAGHVLVDADEEVKLDGKRIQLG